MLKTMCDCLKGFDNQIYVIIIKSFFGVWAITITVFFKKNESILFGSKLMSLVCNVLIK